MLKIPIVALIAILITVLTAPAAQGALFGLWGCTDKLVGNKLEVSGYASVFDIPDDGGDIVRRGAFAQSIQRPEEIKMLFKHGGDVNSIRPKELYPDPIGVWTKIVEDDHGLYVEGYIDTTTPDGRKAMRRVLRGGNIGLSIGYRSTSARRFDAVRLREILDLKLWEISIVEDPKHPLARLN